MQKTGGELIDDGVDSVENEFQNDTANKEGGGKRTTDMAANVKGPGLLDNFDARGGSQALLD